ncbi:hypothetical protein FQN60_002141, partial [Etheostoma spectabile]
MHVHTQQYQQCHPLLSVSPHYSAMTRIMSTCLWPVGDWAGPPDTRSSMCLFTDIKEFVLIPQHTTPANTTKELDALYDVLQDVKKRWKTE